MKSREILEFLTPKLNFTLVHSTGKTTKSPKKTAKRNPKVKRKPSKAGTVPYLRKFPVLMPLSYTKLMYEYNTCHQSLAFDKSSNGVIFNYTHTHIWTFWVHCVPSGCSQWMHLIFLKKNFPHFALGSPIFFPPFFFLLVVFLS